MKLLMLIVEENRKEEVEVLLNRAGVSGYTGIPNVVGVGTTGPRLGSRAFPHTSAIIFSVLEEEELARLLAEIRAYCHDCENRVKMVVWGVEALA